MHDVGATYVIIFIGNPDIDKINNVISVPT